MRLRSTAFDDWDHVPFCQGLNFRLGHR